jgi:2-succinyl-5-enolpyruvyl-6-hydroxy-3-cyclohexene-1-carboxylate synthase
VISSIPHAQQIVLFLKEVGVSEVVISPGSRNAPLTLSFSHDDFFNCYSIVDERCASHFALGMAQQLGKPVVLLCTSGSALLNYYPAVAEAYYSEIPLIVLSADRPPHKIDIGDGQTIQQQGVYGKHIVADDQISMSSDENATTLNHQKLIRVIEALQQRPGPVHLNVPFEEPLYNLVEQSELNSSDFHYIRTPVQISTPLPAEFIAAWEQSERKLILLGTSDPHNPIVDELQLLLDDPSVLVMSEVSANAVHDRWISGIDLLLAPVEKQQEDLSELKPDIVVTYGGMLVSKKIKLFLRNHPPKGHWHLGDQRAYDTFFQFKGHVRTPLASLNQLAKKSASQYQQRWSQQFDRHLELRDKYLQQIPWSDLQVFEVIFNLLPEKLHLQLGNSSTIRYAQLFEMSPGWEIFCNRGTSGIDGCTSTAIGAAVQHELPTVLISGDLSFFYDSNALWNDYIPVNMVFIVINNAGGGIFRILPGDNTTSEFHRYFETRHALDCASLADRYGIAYEAARDVDTLSRKLKKIFSNPPSKPQLLEVFTPTEVNDEVLLGLFHYIRDSI